MATSTRLTCVLGPYLGKGGFSCVFQGTYTPSQIAVAIKKSRVSLRVKRTVLQHEARILQLLQDHPTFPKLIGYGRGPHFEYLAMELLGRSVKGVMKNGKALPLLTVSSIGGQILSALEYMHRKGLVHRDVKPDNVLICPADPSRVCLIDFGMARRYNPPLRPPLLPQLPPLASEAGRPVLRHVMGTLHWCSLNSHRHLDLGPRDDLESLAYTLIFFARGYVPWRSDPPGESTRAAMDRVQRSKEELIVGQSRLVDELPCEFGDLLEVSKRLGPTEIPPYDELKKHWSTSAFGPLDFSPTDALPPLVDSPQLGATSAGGDEDEPEGGDEESLNEEYSDSYFGFDIADWDVQGGRDRSLTFPIEEGELLDAQVPEIVVLSDDGEGEA